MDDESKRFRLSLYATVLLYALADAAIVYFLGGVLVMVWYSVMSTVFGVRHVPGWVLGGVLLALTLAAGVRAAFGTARSRIVAHRRARGLCLHCGYDLRASTERCPECGRTIRAARYGGRPQDEANTSRSMRTLRQRLQHLRTGFYTFALTFIILGGPISLVASLAFGKTAATWTLGGFLILALALAIIASVGSRKRGLERDRRARGLSPGVRV